MEASCDYEFVSKYARGATTYCRPSPVSGGAVPVPPRPRQPPDLPFAALNLKPSTAEGFSSFILPPHPGRQRAMANVYPIRPRAGTVKLYGGGRDIPYIFAVGLPCDNSDAPPETQINKKGRGGPKFETPGLP